MSHMAEFVNDVANALVSAGYTVVKAEQDPNSSVVVNVEVKNGSARYWMSMCELASRPSPEGRHNAATVEQER